MAEEGHPDVTCFGTREAASRAAAEIAAEGLERTITRAGAASFMVSGGSTPAAMFNAMAEMDINWSKVTVGLVDERWVPPDDPGSNERLVREGLLVGRATAARFLPMHVPDMSASAAAGDRADAYAPHCSPISVVMLGMGPDGHTASWFPGSVSLADAFVPPGGATVVAIDAAGCTGAGIYPSRLSLTGPVVIAAEAAILLIFGADKRDILERAMDAPAVDYPIRHAIDGLGDRLKIFWAP